MAAKYDSLKINQEDTVAQEADPDPEVADAVDPAVPVFPEAEAAVDLAVKARARSQNQKVDQQVQSMKSRNHVPVLAPGQDQRIEKMAIEMVAMMNNLYVMSVSGFSTSFWSLDRTCIYR